MSELKGLNVNVEKLVESPAVDQFCNWADSLVRRAFENLLSQIQAHAGAFWIPVEYEGKPCLVIAVNVGDRGSEIEGTVFQSLDSGLVSKAYRDAEVVCHQGIFKHSQQSAEVDKELAQLTAHQIAAPFFLFGHKVGAVTAIQSMAGGIAHRTKWGFDQDAIDQFKIWVEISQRLFEYNVLRQSAREE